MAAPTQDEFPCKLTIDVPFPTSRLASIALKALQVDKELSPLVRRNFSTTSSGSVAAAPGDSEDGTILRTEYSATTNRMLRVAVNSFMESLNLVIDVMEGLDTDVLSEKGSTA